MDNVPMLRAGDALIVSFGRETAQKERDAFLKEVQEGLPGVRVAFLEGITGLAVFRSETSGGGGHDE